MWVLLKILVCKPQFNGNIPGKKNVWSTPLFRALKNINVFDFSLSKYLVEPLERKLSLKFKTVVTFA